MFIGSHRTIFEESDPHFQSVVLLLSGDGVNGAQTFRDDSPVRHTVSVLNSPTNDTTNKLFGSAAINCPGSAAGFTYADHADWQLAPTDSDCYTLEFFFRPETLTAGGSYMIAQFAGAAGQYGWVIFVDAGSSTNLEWFYSYDGTNFNRTKTTSAGLTTNVWHFCAVSKNAAGKVRVFVGPVSSPTCPLRGSATYATNSKIHNSTAEMSIGSGSGGSASVRFDGQLDEIRITKGVCRYDTDDNILMPTKPFPRH